MLGALVGMALLILATLGMSQTTEPPAAELNGRPIVAIEFDCVAPIDRDGLLGIMPMKVGDAWDQSDIEVVRRRLVQTDMFSDIAIDAPPRADGVAVVLHLMRKSVVNSVTFTGNRELSDDVMQRVARVQVGAPWTLALRDYAVTRIHDRYVTEGFVDVRVDAVVRARDAGAVNVTFTIDEGTPVRVSDVVIDGQVPLPMEDIRRAAGIDAGDRYARSRQHKAETALERFLRSKQYYEAQVDSHWEPGAEKTGVLRFTLHPGPLFVVKFSGNDHFSDAHLLGLMDLPTRPIITDATWRALGRRAQRAYQEDGYYQARVAVHIQPGTPKVVRVTIEEGRVFHVAAVQFEGNRGLSAQLLRSYMATQPPSWVPWRKGVFLDDVLDDDLRRLWYLYRRNGFEDAEIADARADVDDERGAIVVTVVVGEGMRTLVGDVVLTRTEVIADRLPKRQVVIGEPLDPDRIEADRQALVKALAQAGYTDAAVTSTVETVPGDGTLTATVRFAAEPGAQQHVGTIIVEDDFDTRWRVIKRELPFKHDDMLDPDALLRGQSNLYRLGLFRSVTVRAVNTEPPSETHDVVVSVPEKPPGTFLWGLGYNTRDGFQGFGEIRYVNLQGLARQVSLRGDVSVDPTDVNSSQYNGLLTFREPRLGTSAWSLRFNVLAQRSTTLINPFSIERLAFVPALERTWLPGLDAGIEGQVEEAKTFDVEPDVLAFNPRDQGRLRTISVGPFIVFDGRDDAFVPRRGVFESLRLRVAPSQFGSQIPFIKLVWQHTHYLPVIDDVVFVYSIRGGWAQTLADHDVVPIQDRFFLGGRTTVRGFDENSIGPLGSTIVNPVGQVDASGNPTGGQMELNLNTEIRFPLVFGLGGVVFVDGGGVYFQDRPVTFHDFRRSAGLGLRYITPVGAVSLEYGFKLDPFPGDSVGAVHFSIGNVF